MARRDPLEGVGHEVPARRRLRPRLLVELPDATRELVADRLLRAVEEVRALRLGHRGDPLELLQLLLLRPLELLVELLRGDLAVVHALLAARELGQLPIEVLLERRDALLGLGDLRATVAHLLLDLRAECQLALTRLDLGLAADRIGLPLGLVDQERPAAAHLAQPALLQHHDRDHGRHRSDDDSDCDAGDDEHAHLERVD